MQGFWKEDISVTLKVGSGVEIQSPPAVAFTASEMSKCEAYTDIGATLKGGSGERGYPDPSDGNGHNLVGGGMSVRRLTPTECERLQAFPDGWTAIEYKGKPAADGPRYKALGNSMTVNVIEWILRNIERRMG